MLKIILPILVFSISTPILAASCNDLYEAKASQIREDKAYTNTVGNYLFIQNNQLGYNPGIQVPGRVDNWAQDFLYAIKWGPLYISMTDENPRRDWLEAFRKAIKNDCDLPTNDYKIIQAMLKELVEDGSFCPNNKILEPGFLKGKKDFKKVLKAAVADHRFPEYCKKNSANDDSSRQVKSINSGTSPSKSNSTATEQ
jgi:hypothetical protein